MNELIDSGIDLMALCEGIHLQPYICPAGKLTSLIGHVIKPGEEKIYIPGMTIAGAKELCLKDREAFLAKVPKLTLEFAHQVKRQDLKLASGEVDKRLKQWKVTVNNQVYTLLVDLVYNGGPGFLDQSIREYLLKGDPVGAVLRAPLYCNAEVKPKILRPLAGLTFRRYSFVWFALTGEAWRIGSEASEDKDWAEVALFLTKLTALLRKWGRDNPLPYPCNRREAQYRRRA